MEDSRLIETFRLKSLGSQTRVEVSAPVAVAEWAYLGETIVPARFEAVVKDPRYPVRLDIAVEDGLPRVVSIGRIEGPVRLGRKYLDRGPALTSKHLRLPLDSVLRELAVAVARVWGRSDYDDGETWVPVRGAPEHRLRLEALLIRIEKPQLGRGARVSDEFLQGVAAIYRAALESGRHPTQAVYTSLNAAPKVGPISRTTAGRWVAEARRRGFLPPTEPRTPRA